MKIWKIEVLVSAICFAMMSAIVMAQEPNDMEELWARQAELRAAEAKYDEVRKRVLNADREAFNKFYGSTDAATIASSVNEQLIATKAAVAELQKQFDAMHAKVYRCDEAAKATAKDWPLKTTILGVRAAANPLFACLAE